VTSVTAARLRTCFHTAMSTIRSEARPLATLHSVPIDPHLQRGLDRLAASTGRSLDALIAEAVAQYVDERGRAAVPSWVGAARRHDVTVCRPPRSR
jgi:hypothetical protein